MVMIIDKSKKLVEIQMEFQKRFPFLKIEFYKTPHLKGEGSKIENRWNNNLTIEDILDKNASGTIKIHGLMTVAELEVAFKNAFGLSIQVFRKSGNIWLQTIKTDHWTLAEQNHKAMEQPQSIPFEIIDAKDRMELE